MPTVAMSPWIFAHSCSFVYLRSVGRFISCPSPSFARGTTFLALALVKRKAHDGASVALSADLDVELSAIVASLFVHEHGGDVLAAQRGRRRSGTHFADALVAAEHRVAGARGGAAIHDDTDDAIVGAGRLLRGKR